MNEIKVSILEYLGKIESGVIVLLSFVYNDKYYEGTFFYTDEYFILTVDDLLEKELGVDNIELYEGFGDVVKRVIKLIIPYGEIHPRIDDINFERWNKAIEEYTEEMSSQENKDNKEN